MKNIFIMIGFILAFNAFAQERVVKWGCSATILRTQEKLQNLSEKRRAKSLYKNIFKFVELSDMDFNKKTPLLSYKNIKIEIHSINEFLSVMVFDKNKLKSETLISKFDSKLGSSKTFLEKELEVSVSCHRYGLAKVVDNKAIDQSEKNFTNKDPELYLQNEKSLISNGEITQQ